MQTRKPVFVSDRTVEAKVCSPFKSQSCVTVIPSNRGHYCVVHLCMNNLQWCLFLSNCMWFFVLMCMWMEVSCLPVCMYTHTHTGYYLILHPSHFFLSSYSPLHRLCPWMWGLFGFSSSFPLFNVTLVLLSVSWPGHDAFFFFLALQRKLFLTGRDGGGMTN